MSEFVVLAVLALAATLYIALPRAGDDVPETAPDVGALRERRAQLLRELRELDDDLAAGRISAQERAAGRQALGPALRAATEALRAHGGADA